MMLHSPAKLIITVVVITSGIGPGGSSTTRKSGAGLGIPASWTASLTLSEYGLQTGSSVFEPSVFDRVTAAFGFKLNPPQTGVTSEASVRSAQIQYTATLPVVSRNVTVFGRVTNVKVRLDLQLDRDSGEMSVRDFRIERLGRIRAHVVGLWILDYCIDFVLWLFLELGHSTLQRIGETLGRNIVGKSLRAK